MRETQSEVGVGQYAYIGWTRTAHLWSSQKVRKGAVLIALLALVGLTMVSQSASGLDSPMHEGIEAVGLARIDLRGGGTPGG